MLISRFSKVLLVKCYIVGFGQIFGCSFGKRPHSFSLNLYRRVTSPREIVHSACLRVAPTENQRRRTDVHVADARVQQPRARIDANQLVQHVRIFRGKDLRQKNDSISANDLWIIIDNQFCHDLSKKVIPFIYRTSIVYYVVYSIIYKRVFKSDPT